MLLEIAINIKSSIELYSNSDNDPKFKTKVFGFQKYYVQNITNLRLDRFPYKLVHRSNDDVKGGGKRKSRRNKKNKRKSRKYRRKSIRR